MSEPIEDLYFNWLYDKVAWREVVTPSTSYQSLLYVLHSTEFVWLISGDDNRAEDGQQLRRDFLKELNLAEPEEPWMLLSCSVLEMLIAFSLRTEFQTATSSSDWFWIFLDNLGIAEISDATYSENSSIIPPILETFVWRQYNSLGHGGIFPLYESEHDQKEVELWYQFCEYVIEQDIS